VVEALVQLLPALEALEVAVLAALHQAIITELQALLIPAAAVAADRTILPSARPAVMADRASSSSAT
jgi:hypothetical protein